MTTKHYYPQPDQTIAVVRSWKNALLIATSRAKRERVKYRVWQNDDGLWLVHRQWLPLEKKR